MSKTISQAEYDFLDHSNRIEGVYDGDSLGNAIGAWTFLKTKKKLTTGIILKVHKILMLNQPLQPDEIGYFRKIPVYVSGREGAPPFIIPEQVDQWVLNVNDLIENGIKESEIFKDKMPRHQHVKYEHIHPFVDGNGRTGRIFYNWTRLKLGLPIHVIKEKERQDYYQWFRELK